MPISSSAAVWRRPCLRRRPDEADMVLDDLGNKAVQGAATGGRLLQHRGDLGVRLQRPPHRLDLATDAIEPLQQLGFFFLGRRPSPLTLYRVWVYPKFDRMASLEGHPVPVPALSGRTQPARDHMNPRSSSQPTESHSRRILPAMIVPLGWTVARVVPVTATPIARSAPGLAARGPPGFEQPLEPKERAMAAFLPVDSFGRMPRPMFCPRPSAARVAAGPRRPAAARC